MQPFEVPTLQLHSRYNIIRYGSPNGKHSGVFRDYIVRCMHLGFRNVKVKLAEYNEAHALHEFKYRGESVISAISHQGTSNQKGMQNFADRYKSHMQRFANQISLS